MKKLDYLIITIIFILICVFYIFIFNPYMSSNSNNIQLIINNEIIDEITLDKNSIYTIESNDQDIFIYKNNQLIKTIKNKNQKKIENKIEINNKHISVIQSNCVGKDCMFMDISEQHRLPIICTNGIVIKYSEKVEADQSDIII